jgi:hypothetical protein
MVVQLSAFGMTLRRKGWIDSTFGLILYASVLVVGMMVILFNLQQSGILYPAMTVGNVAAVLRMDLGCNKYLLWPMVAVALWTLASRGLLVESDLTENAKYASLASFVVLFIMAALRGPRSANLQASQKVE